MLGSQLLQEGHHCKGSLMSTLHKELWCQAHILWDNPHFLILQLAAHQLSSVLGCCCSL